MKKRILSILLAICLLLSMLSITAYAEDNILSEGKCGENLTYKLTRDGVLTIQGTGDMFDFTRDRYSYHVLTHGVYRETPWGTWYNEDADTKIREVHISEGVTSIGDYAFWNSEQGFGYTNSTGRFKFESIHLPNSLERIGYDAFSGCSDLTNITIPDGVTSIGMGAFSGCNSLENIVLSSSLTMIDDYLFTNCSNLTSITIPNGVTSVGYHAFKGCNSLTSIMIPNSVTSIGGDAFNGCGSLASITIPNSVSFIGDNAFRSCGSLTSITVNEVNSNYYSSSNCLIEKNTKKLIRGCNNSVIPNDITSIEDYAFDGCNNLVSITIPNSVTSIGDNAFEGCVGTTRITIADSVYFIGGYAFNGCSSLKKIILPESITSIGLATFDECSSLENITIPSNVITIDNSAFDECSNLKSILIPNSVTSIGVDAFRDCNSLSDVYYRGSQDNWNAIDFWRGNSCLFNATIHYNWEGAIPDTQITPDTPSDAVTYTRFGQYNGSTQNYVIDPVTGFGKNLMETVTIDGITYDVADTCEQEALLLPTDYLGNYYYIAYNLNASNEVSEAKIMPGVICTLEGYDPVTKVVDTDQLAPIVDGNTLPSGSYYVSDVTASSFPSDQIGSWVGDQIRIYCVGEQIFKVIHIVEGNGVITDYDEDNSRVYIDNIGYDVYPDAELINTIKQSLLYSKDYVLYDNILVSLSFDNKYLSVEINNTGKSYFVGDEIRFFIYDCTETEDDYLHRTKPEGLAIQISDNEAISLKKHIEHDDFAESVFVADKPGVVTVSISDDITSTPINVTLHITEDKYQSFRADNVPTYEYDVIIDKDFYNAYVNGMYVTDFTYRSNSNESYTFDFAVYNETYAPGVVEVYDCNGEIINIEIIHEYGGEVEHLGRCELNTFVAVN